MGRNPLLAALRTLRGLPRSFPATAGPPPSTSDPEFKLPKRSSLSIVILSNVFLQISFFIIVSSSSAFAEHLGGTASFSGLVIGIPTVFSALALIPLMKYDGGKYKLPLHIACASSIIAHILYGSAYAANFLYLILMGRIVNGFGFTGFLYAKRYCTDARFVGLRRRTMLAGWIVVGQGMGLSAGPFIGGLLYKVGFHNAVFNGYTSPGWVMVGVWAVFWVCVTLWYEDETKDTEPSPEPSIEMTTLAGDRQTSGIDISGPSSSTEISRISQRTHDINIDPEPSIATTEPAYKMTAHQWGVVACMCWHAMTCFFVLGAWESNISVYGAASHFQWSPFAAGNFIALGGILTFPFLLSNLILAPRVQDRHTLALGSALGMSGLLIMMGLLAADRVTFLGFLVAWFLVALGFNLASTVTLSLLSKQLPGEWNGRTSLLIQYSNYLGRTTGAIWGGSGVKVGMLRYVGLEIGLVGIGALMFMFLWRDLKAKTG